MVIRPISAIVDDRESRSPLVDELRPALVLEGTARDLQKCGMRWEAIQGALVTVSLFVGLPKSRATLQRYVRQSLPGVYERPPAACWQRAIVERAHLLVKARTCDRWPRRERCSFTTRNSNTSAAGGIGDARHGLFGRGISQGTHCFRPKRDSRWRCPIRGVSSL